uniref:DUF2192 domain-containing protein n=1 Tax=Ignisphaera aggregans TaxID=334771 RepID=A0A7C2VDM6_9CREN
MNIKRKRIMALVNAWSRIVKDGVCLRDHAVDILKKSYEEIGVEPIRGSSFSADLYDKDMASLYIVGKWGLGLDKELDKEFLKKLFSVEMMLEEIVEIMQKVSSFDELCKNYAELCQSLDDKFVARVLRFVFTLYYFGFIDRQTFINFMKKSYAVLKPMEETIRRFAKFVIAFEVGRKIAENEVKTKMDLNVAKNAVALELEIPNALPSVGYIIEVARHFFELPQNLTMSLKSENKNESSD